MSFVGPLDYVCSAAMALCPGLGTSMCYPRRDTAQGLRHRSLLALLKRQPVREAYRTWRAGFAATAGTSRAGLRERWQHDLSLC